MECYPLYDISIRISNHIYRETTPMTHIVWEPNEEGGAHNTCLKSQNETVLGVRCQGQYMQACCAGFLPMHEACFG